VSLKGGEGTRQEGRGERTFLDLVEDDDSMALAFLQVLEERAFDGVDVAVRERGKGEGEMNKTKTIREHAGRQAIDQKA